MPEVYITTDQSSVVTETEVHEFHPYAPDEEFSCKACSLFVLCCQMQSTVESEFPFPCVDEFREDNQNGNFQLSSSTST